MITRVLYFLFFLPYFAFASDINSDYVAKAETFLEQISTMKADFTQINEDRVTGKGVFYLDRGIKRMKWCYDSPNKIDILVNKKKISYYDKDLDEVSYTSVNSGLFTLFTSEKIGFGEDIKVENVEILEGFVQIKLVNTNIKSEYDEAAIILIFNKKKWELVGIKYLQNNGQTTDINFSNMIYNMPMDLGIFRIDRAFLGKK